MQVNVIIIMIYSSRKRNDIIIISDIYRATKHTERISLRKTSLKKETRYYSLADEQFPFEPPMKKKTEHYSLARAC